MKTMILIACLGTGLLVVRHNREEVILFV